jgi:divalent metal cation (Fe/Co/Zn/Cd) transporter
MDNYKLINRIQFVFGTVITLFAISIFVNMTLYSLMSIQDQLNMIWFILFFVLLMYGVIQFMHAIIEIYQEDK